MDKINKAGRTGSDLNWIGEGEELTQAGGTRQGAVMDSPSQGIVGVAAGQAQLFITVAGRGGSLLEAGCSSSWPSRGLLVAGEGGGWSPAGGGFGRRVGESEAEAAA